MRKGITKTSSNGAVVLAAVAAVVLCGSSALAAAPSTTVFEGVMRGATGAAAPDGNYQVTFRLYDGEKSNAPYWTEGPSAVAVKSGQFSYVLGSNKPLDIAVFSAKSQNWLELQVGADPAMPRQRLHATAYAWTAADVSCSGCVSVSEMKFDGDVNIGAHAFTAGKIVAKEIAASTISAQKFVGDGSGLTGIKSQGSGVKPSTCPNGKVVVGIAGDGSLQCASTASSLPNDGLKNISNGTLSNNFTDVWASKKTPIPIPDHTPTGINDIITIPDLGIAEAFSISLDVSNSAVDQIEVFLIDPKDDKYTLYSKSLKGGSLLVSFPPAKPVSGDLSKWVGKNLKGNWTLKVVDNHFLNNKFDGAINKWSINISTLSNKKVQVNGDLVVTGKITTGGGGATTFQADNTACNATKKGQVRYSHARGAEICQGEFWVALVPKPVVLEAHCSHTRSYASGWSYYCLNKTSLNTASDYLTLSTKAPGNGSSSYSSQWQSDSQIGRVTVKIPGLYRLNFKTRSRQNSSWWYGELRVNNKQIEYQDNYEYSGYHTDTNRMEKLVWLNKGDYVNAVARTSSNSSSYYAWDGCGGTVCPYGGLRIEYVGHDWK